MKTFLHKKLQGSIVEFHENLFTGLNISLGDRHARTYNFHTNISVPLRTEFPLNKKNGKQNIHLNLYLFTRSIWHYVLLFVSTSQHVECYCQKCAIFHAVIRKTLRQFVYCFWNDFVDQTFKLSHK